MVSRTFKVGKAFGSAGVLAKATQDVPEAVGGGVESALNDSAALGTGNAGDLKFASNRKTLHMYDGTEWDRIAGGADADPVIITDASAASVQSLSTDSHRQTFKVLDPEGFPISYSISYMRDSDKVFFTNDSSNLPPPLAHPAIITKATNGTATYKFLTRSAESDGSGNSTTDLYKARYMGTDGARHAVSTKDFQLIFATAELQTGGQTYAIGQTVNLTYTGDMGTFAIVNKPATVDIEAQGGAGGRGMWSSNNDPGAPGGHVKARFTLPIGTYYYFIGEGNKAVSGKGGAGGGSTDVRIAYPGGSTFSITNFMDNTSLNSRIITAGGGGGSHGGSYGYWGATNSPGAGGPTTTETNSRGSNDGGFVGTGASTSAAGQDGGSNMDNKYTASGSFGRGGVQSSPLQTLSYSSTSNYRGWGWPNGGSGTTWVSAGGGGGWYGGATNWPHGGGGSNYVQSSGSVTLVSTAINVGEVQTGNGLLNITLVS